MLLALALDLGNGKLNTVDDQVLPLLTQNRFGESA